MWLRSAATYGLLAVQKHLGFSPSSRTISPPLSFSSTWQVLGPFQIGTREATWGADPLEVLGGFRALEYDTKSHYASSLASNATVGWSIVNAASILVDSFSTSATLTVNFPNIDWTFMQDVYGWAALQYQAWARGYLTVAGIGLQTVVLHTDHVLEFYIDEKHYFGGDFYAYRRAPVVLHLCPGNHRLDLRLVRDVRAMGGTGDSSITIGLVAELSFAWLQLASDKALLPDLVDGQLAGMYGSLTVRNDALDIIDIVNISISHPSYTVSLMASHGPVSLAAGQTRPLAFTISCERACASAVAFHVHYRTSVDHGTGLLTTKPQVLEERTILEPLKTTHLHPGGMVSYAILRAPRNMNCTQTSNGLPVLLQLHGAGLEAEDSLVSHALDPLPDLCAWVLFPTGVTPWSGDDWHVWGFADVEAAIASINEWIKVTGWQGPKADIDRWLVSGHSNGGQGTWYALTHRPDKVIAAAPVSGYSSIQNYVPYHLWHEMSPAIRAVLDSSLSSYRHEALLANAQGIPILQQHGSADDNVPAYHSRLLSQLLTQAGADFTFNELLDKGHWFDGVMTTDALSAFFQHQLQATPRSTGILRNTTLVVASPGDNGPKNGVVVLELDIPGQIGRVEIVVSPSSGACSILTSNVLAIQIQPSLAYCSDVSIDGQDLVAADVWPRSLLRRGPGLKWMVLAADTRPNYQVSKSNEDQDTLSTAQRRSKRQSGAMDAILRSSGTIQISSGSSSTRHVALQISRNLCQYFAADTEIVGLASTIAADQANIITVVRGNEDSNSTRNPYFPLVLGSETISMRDDRGFERTYHAEHGLAAIFLHPLKDDALELVVWGADELGLDIAARLVPMLTGVGQPDFVVADAAMLWNGAGGVLAMGLFDTLWNVSKNSYFT